MSDHDLISRVMFFSLFKGIGNGDGQQRSVRAEGQRGNGRGILMISGQSAPRHRIPAIYKAFRPSRHKSGIDGVNGQRVDRVDDGLLSLRHSVTLERKSGV